MNTEPIAALNQVASAWLGWMRPMAWQVAILVAVLSILSWLLRKQSARLRYALWLLVPLRLALAPTLALPTGWAWWVLPITPESAANSPELLVAEIELDDPPAAIPVTESVPPAPSALSSRLPPTDVPQPLIGSELLAPSMPASPPSLSPHGVWFCGWAAIALLLALRLAIGWGWAVRMLRRSTPWPSTAALDNIERPRRVRIHGLHGISTPMLIGAWRPTILLPIGIDNRLSAEELETVVVHELQHVARNDVLVKLVQTVVGIVYWFHPLVWLSNSWIDRLREEACDEATVSALRGSCRVYGSGLVKVAELMTNDTPALALSVVESGTQVRRRLGRILDPRFPAGRRLSYPAIATLLATAAILLPSAARHVGAALAEMGESPTERDVRTGADPEYDSADAPHGVHTLVVTVVDSETGKPVSGAEIGARSIDGPWDRNTLPRRLTDEVGRYRLNIPLWAESSSGQFQQFYLRLTHGEYVTHNALWTASGGHVREGLPAELRIGLERGVSIGGVVQDQSGRVLPGVRVLLLGSGHRSHIMGGSLSEQQYRSVDLRDPDEAAAVTDRHGRWEFARFPRDLRMLEVTFVRPDDSRTAFATSAADQMHNNRPVLTIDELLAKSAVATLDDGLPVRGVVVDEAGRPLPGMTVREGYGHNIVHVSTFETDIQGRFERSNRVPREWIYTASGPGRATVSVVAKVEAGMPVVRIVLPPADPLSIRIVDDADQPLAGAKIRLRRGDNNGQILEWDAYVDHSGTAIWTNAPTQAVTFWAVDPWSVSFQSRQFTAQAGDDVTVVLGSNASLERAAINITATDANTGEPVLVKAIRAIYDHVFSHVLLAEPNAAQCRVEVLRSGFSPSLDLNYRLQIDAEGYEPFTSEFLHLGEGDKQLAVALVRGATVDGTVRLSDGSLAGGAVIWMKPDSVLTFHLNESGQHLNASQMIKIVADDDGAFTLPIVVGDCPIAIEHAAGFLETKGSDIQRSGEAVIQPWGRIEGQQTVKGRPKAEESIWLTRLTHSRSHAFDFYRNSTTDADGRFVFERVPAGEYRLYRQAPFPSLELIPTTHLHPVTVAAGETMIVEYGAGGRTVTGTAVPDSPSLVVNWQHDPHKLVRRVPPPPAVNQEDFASAEAFSVEWDALGTWPAYIEHERQSQTYVLNFESTGAFQVHGVLPGEYKLQIRVTKPLRPGEVRILPQAQDELGLLVHDITVPSGDGPFDVGKVVVPMTGIVDEASGAPIVF